MVNAQRVAYLKALGDWQLTLSIVQLALEKAIPPPSFSRTLHAPAQPSPEPANPQAGAMSNTLDISKAACPRMAADNDDAYVIGPGFILETVYVAKSFILSKNDAGSETSIQRLYW